MKTRYVFLIIFGIGLLTFFNSFFNPFIYDDFAQIMFSSKIRDLSNIQFFISHGMGPGLTAFSRFAQAFYRPVQFILYTVLFQLFGLNSFPFHILQMLLHTLSTLLIFLIFSNFIIFPLSIIFSIIFLVHPLNTEAVIYIADLQDVCFVFFGLLSTYLFVRKKNNLLSVANIFVISLFLLISLLSKETGVLFLLILPLYSLLFSRKNIKRVLISILFTLSFYLPLRFNSVSNLEANTASNLTNRSELLTRLMTLPRIIIYYLEKFILPTNFSIAQAWLVKKLDFYNFYLPLFLDLLFIVLIYFCGKHLYRNKKEYFRPYIFFVLWFSIGQIFHSNIFPLDLTVADRWFYFPMVGLLGMIGIFISSLINSKSKYKNLVDSILISLSTIAILILICLTIVRNSQWQSYMSLYSHDIKYSEFSPWLNNFYGEEFLLQRRFDEAKYYLEKSYMQDPHIGSNLIHLGNLYELKGDYSKAKSLYKRCLDIKDIQKFGAFEGLIRITLYIEKNPQDALDISNTALKHYPWDVDLIRYSAISKYLTGDKEGGLKSTQILLKQDSRRGIKELYYMMQTGELKIDNIPKI